MSSKRGHPLGPGPVFASEWLTSSRRWQGYFLRSLFVTLLLAALVVVWWSGRRDASLATLQGLARVGESFFLAVVGTQLTLVLLAAPAATAGAICLDRARGTLTHLLVTDLTDAEIVLGKLAARLVPVLGLVGCALPVMAILTLLGGVDPAALMGAFAVTLGVSVLGCGLALAFSLWAGKTHEALLGTYAIWGLWLLARPMIAQWNRTTGLSWPMPGRVADPFQLAFAPYIAPGSVGQGDYLAFLGVTWTVSAALVALAVLRLRPVCCRDAVRKGTSRPFLWDRLAGRMGKWSRRIDPLPRLSLDLNPVLWREWHRTRPSRGARIITLLYVSLATFFSLSAIFSGSQGVAAWVNGLQVSVGLLLLSVTAATSLAEERVRGSLDVLLATPLPTRQIVLGKWMGSFRRVPLLAVLPILVILGAGRGILGVSVAVLILALTLCNGAAISSLGLAMATWNSRLGRAVGLTVTIHVVATVGWLMLMMMVIRNHMSAEGPMMGSPFFWAGELTFELFANRSRPENFGWGVFWAFAYGFAAVGLLVATLATFNRCLGRVEYGVFRLAPAVGTEKEVVLVPIEGTLGEFE